MEVWFWLSQHACCWLHAWVWAGGMEGCLQAPYSYFIHSWRVCDLGLQWALQGCPDVWPFDYPEIYRKCLRYEKASSTKLWRLIASMYFKHLSSECTLMGLITVHNPCFRRTSWRTPQQKHSLLTFHLSGMAYVSQTPYAYRWHTRVARSINKRTWDANPQICKSHLLMFWHHGAPSRRGCKSASTSPEI